MVNGVSIMPDEIPVRDNPCDCISCGKPVTEENDIRTGLGDWHKSCNDAVQKGFQDGSINL